MSTPKNDDISLTPAQVEAVQRMAEEVGGSAWTETEEDGTERVHLYLPDDE